MFILSLKNYFFPKNHLTGGVQCQQWLLMSNSGSKQNPLQGSPHDQRLNFKFNFGSIILPPLPNICPGLTGSYTFCFIYHRKLWYNNNQGGRISPGSMTVTQLIFQHLGRVNTHKSKGVGIPHSRKVRQSNCNKFVVSRNSKVFPIGSEASSIYTPGAD